MISAARDPKLQYLRLTLTGGVTRFTRFESPTRLAFEAKSDIVTALELAFSKKSLRRLCENEAKAKRELGAKAAEKLRRRLADLRAATCVTDLVAGQPRELEGRRQIAVDLCEGSRIVICANHNAIPMIESGRVDWSRVSRVKILRIESNHG